jgi:hypothetical protein
LPARHQIDVNLAGSIAVIRASPHGRGGGSWRAAQNPVLARRCHKMVASPHAIGDLKDAIRLSPNLAVAFTTRGSAYNVTGGQYEWAVYPVPAHAQLAFSEKYRQDSRSC